MVKFKANINIYQTIKTIILVFPSDKIKTFDIVLSSIYIIFGLNIYLINFNKMKILFSNELVQVFSKFQNLFIYIIYYQHGS